jgi:DNA repair photolyase
MTSMPPSNLMTRPAHGKVAARAVSPAGKNGSNGISLGASKRDGKEAHHAFDFWTHPAVIAPNNFVFKSLSNWAFNIAVGCSHGCRFCYVPSVSTIKQTGKLASFGVSDPDAEWGNYVLLRPWDEDKFLASLDAAESTPRKDLKADGNRAVIYCSTTDPYQVLFHPDPVKRKELATAAERLVVRSLELILGRSTLNVRILTRSPLAKRDFDLFKKFGKRLLFGMSLPTLRDDLARIYEPKAPSPTQRLAALKQAKEAGLQVYVAMAPTYPECDKEDFARTLKEVGKLDPVTIYHEPINIRAENVARIAAQAERLGVALKTEVFNSVETWQDYARESMDDVETLAKELGLSSVLHLWPDKSLGSRSALSRVKNPDLFEKWLHRQWKRVSHWPS